MSKINIEFKDRIVEFPNRYSLTDNGDGTYTLTPFPGEITEEGTPINAANMNEIVDKHNALYDVVHQPRAFGDVLFTGSIAPGETLTKTIPIGAGMSRGRAIVCGGTVLNSMYVTFDRISEHTKAIGGVDLLMSYSDREQFFGAWSKAQIGSVTESDPYGEPQTTIGYAVTGSSSIKITDFFIVGDNIQITFKNDHTTSSRPLYCRIEYEVE